MSEAATWFFLLAYPVWLAESNLTVWANGFFKRGIRRNTLAVFAAIKPSLDSEKKDDDGLFAADLFDCDNSNKAP